MNRLHKKNDYKYLKTKVHINNTYNSNRNHDKHYYNRKLERKTLSDKEYLEGMLFSTHIAKKVFECSICCAFGEDIVIEKACGKCSGVACRDCLSQWYKSTKIGDIINKAKLSCPFCKSIPSLQLTVKYGSDIYKFYTPQKIFENLKDDYYQAMCTKCNKIHDYLKKTCTNDVPVLNGNFICEQCKPIKEIVTKECPECHVMIEKLGGCNRIQCTHCYIEICFVCLYSNMDRYDVYDHLTTLHGGYGTENDYVNDPQPNNNYGIRYNYNFNFGLRYA